MKQLIRQGIPFALSTLAVCAAQVAHVAHAAPSTGAYASDPQNTWVQDRVGDQIGTVNMIMCIIGSMRGDAKVNQGAYLALIDMNKCEGRGDSSKSTSTSAGASNATNYMSAIVQATQASTSDPLLMNAWMSMEEEGGKMTIYARVEAEAGPDAAAGIPNGLFSMTFCGLDEASDAAIGAGGTHVPSDCVFRGRLASTREGLSFYEEGMSGGGGGGGGGGSYVTRMMLQSDPDTDSGLGLVDSNDGGNSQFTFAYDGTRFRRDDGTTDACFLRDEAQADFSTWRYGTYGSNGDRLEVSNPGFPVKFTHTSGGATKEYYGFWSFWGLWLPQEALQNINSGTLTRRVGEADVTLAVQKHGGKLWRLTRHASTLDAMKNTPMMFWVHQTLGSLSGGSNYEIKWNGTALQAVARQVCDQSGCAPQPLNAPVTLDADDLRNAGMKALPVFFPSGGGNGSVLVPDAGEFGGDAAIYYRTRDVVAPGGSDLNLSCVNQCLKSGTDLSTALGSQGSPYLGDWGPSTSRYSYTFSGGMLTHDDNGDADVDASGVDPDGLGHYQWGLNSGSMIATADLASIRCDANGAPNTAGTHYCPGLVEGAEVVYQWETGPNQWNQYFGATANGQPVVIDPPLSLSLAASSGTITGDGASAFHGNTLQLQYSGFGELHGIPGHCVNRDTNEVVNCEQNTRWVPAFSIQDGTAITDGGSGTYFVKFLERELRLKKENSCGTNLNAEMVNAAALTLPNGSGYTSPRAVLGYDKPTLGSSKPAVIDGTVQDAE